GHFNGSAVVMMPVSGSIVNLRSLSVKSGFTGIVPTMVPLGSPSLISSWTRVSTALLCIARPIAAVLSCGNIGDLRGTNRCIREETSPGRGGSDPPRAAPRETRVCGCSRMLRERENGTFRFSD
ncbi:hypothetical protein ALC57_19037, partial [Trachymyrmex cornetzi]